MGPTRPSATSGIAATSSARLASVSGRRNRKSQPPWRQRLPAPREALAAAGRGLRRALPALCASAAAAAVTGLLWLGYQFLTTSPRFAITAFEFHGNHVRSDAELRAALPIADGANVFRAHTGELSAALRADPWLASASVERRLPGTLVVSVREHVAAALVELDGLYLVDARGVPFKRRTGDEGRDLPIVTGLARAAFNAAPGAGAEVVRHALAVVTAWHAQPERPRLGEVHVDARRGLVLHTLDEATAVWLPPSAWQGDVAALAARLTQFDRAWAALSPAERARVRALHLDHDTRPDHVTVALADA